MGTRFLSAVQLRRPVFTIPVLFNKHGAREMAAFRDMSGTHSAIGGRACRQAAPLESAFI
jgi:hypothetical protein